jgi:hypothetical protein
MTNLIQYQFVVKILFSNLRKIHLLYDPRLNGLGGMNHLTGKRGFPLEYRRSPQEWLGQYTTSSEYGGGPVVTATIRNFFQNLRCPAWTREHGICQQKDEKATESKRPYYCYALFDDREKKVEPMKVRFIAREGRPEPVNEFDEPLPRDLKALLSFSPVLWDGVTLSEERMAAGLSDWPHLYDLRTSDARGLVGADVEHAERLTQVALAHHLSGEDEAGAAIVQKARGLRVEHNYLHHGWGVAEDGIVFVVAHGSLKKLGELAKRAGCSHAIITENGGSIQIGLRRADGQFRPLAESYYFREPTISMLAMELASDKVLFEGRSDLTMIADSDQIGSRRSRNERR